MAKVKDVHVEFGVSIAVNDKTWIKATSGMTVEFDTPEDKTDDVFEMAWNRVTHEVAEQVKSFGVQLTANGEPVK